MLRRIALAVFAVACAWLGGRAILRALASDESKIRRAVAEACEGFGEARMNPILSLLARDFVDETSGFQREDLRAAIAAAFFQEKDPKTRAFPYRLEMPEDEVQVVVNSAAKSADVRLHGFVRDIRGDRVAWEFRVDGLMEERDDGWQIVKTTHETVNGSFRLKAR